MANLDKSQIDEFLTKAQSASLATIGSDGYPYNVPVSFVWKNDKIYIHARNVGEKVSNMENNSKVGLAVYKMGELDYDPNQKRACAVMVNYESVIIKGEAKSLEGLEEKREILWDIVKKYTPELESASMEDKDVLKTSVFEITPVSFTGKSYKKS